VGADIREKSSLVWAPKLIKSCGCRNQVLMLL
jgi:hypothetical protein